MFAPTQVPGREFSLYGEALATNPRRLDGDAMGPWQFLGRVKIYATDIDQEALNKARSWYPPKAIESRDEELMNGYF